MTRYMKCRSVLINKSLNAEGRLRNKSSQARSPNRDQNLHAKPINFLMQYKAQPTTAKTGTIPGWAKSRDHLLMFSVVYRIKNESWNLV
jgi:hypothetical protein